MGSSAGIVNVEAQPPAPWNLALWSEAGEGGKTPRELPAAPSPLPFRNCSAVVALNRRHEDTVATTLARNQLPLYGRPVNENDPALLHPPAKPRSRPAQDYISRQINNLKKSTPKSP